MITKTLAGWNLSFTQKEDETTIKVTHVDNSPISDTDADIGTDGELGYRLTSELIESEYNDNGDAKAVSVEDTVSVGNWKVELINDEDNHLNIYCIHTTSDSLEHLSLTNGTDHSKDCEIVITDASYMH